VSAFLEPDEALARVQSEIAAAHARAAVATAVRADLDRVRGVASSTGGEVRVEVDPSGRLTDLQIQDAAMDRTGRDLARIVVDLVQRAGQDAGRQAVALAAAAFGEGDPVTAHLADEVAGRWGEADPR